MDDAPIANPEQTEQQLRPLIENATDIITVLNADGTRRYVSPSIERLLGYMPEELIGKNVFELVHPDDTAELRRLFTAGVTHPGIVITKQFRIRAKNGVWRIHEATAHNLLNDAAVRGIVINSRDITARKKLERRLTVQFEAARILSETAIFADAATPLLQAICDSLGWDLGQLWIVDRDVDKLRWLASWQVEGLNAGDFIAASRGRLFSSGAGLPGVIWAGRAPQWILDVADDTGFTRSMLAAKADLHSMFGFPIKLGDEVSAVMEFFSRERQSPDDSLLELMTAIGTQIAQFIQREHAETERSKLYEREQRARLELEATMHRMHQVQIVTEVALSHLSLDKLLTELLDRVRDAMDVDTVVILLLEEDNKLVAWATKGLELDVGIRVPLGAGFAGRVAAQKEPIAIDELRDSDTHTPFLRERGVRSLLGVPLLIEGRVLGVIHVGRRTLRSFTDDDTRLLELVAFRIALAIDNARLFEEERAARHEAEAASRAKDEFLTTISHELRTPLTPIIGWVHMIRNGLLSQKESVHGLEVVEKNSHALKRLINDLLDMSAILSGKMRMEQKSVQLQSAVHEAVEMVRPTAENHGVQLEIVSGKLSAAFVTGDRTRLVQAFSNLLDNAIKFSPAGGLVKIDYDSAGNTATISVEDHGCGISPEFLPFVFERFRQEDGSKTRAHGGLGLGLALVKSFVESHHGTVKAESAGHGLGCRFVVTLPCTPVIAVETAGVSAEVPREPAPAHLMIIEDDPDTLEMLRATLETHGFRVTACESAAESLRLAPENAVDLIISDIGMPNMDGFEMIRRLRELENYERVPAIALSGYASRKDVNAALAAGFDAHMSKPVDPRELLKLIKRFVKRDQP
jgi:PAS domain S-box-containing protein